MDNRVEIVVGAQDNSKLGLDGLKARLTELGRKVAEARVEVTDKEAAAKLAMMRVNLDSLSRRVASPRLSLQGAARVEAQILALDVSFDHLNEKASDLSVQGGALFRLGPLFAKVTSGGGGLAAVLPVLIPLVAALATALMPLVASLALVTVGFAGFAAAAVPSIAKVIEARTKLKAAEKAYDDATTKAQRQAALKQEKQATEGLTAAQKGLLGPMDQIAGLFHRLSRAVQPEVTRAFAASLKILKDLFPALRPLMVAAGKALDGFLSRIDDWLRSPSGKRFLEWMETKGPAAIHHFMTALWRVLNVFGQVVTFMYHEGQAMDQRFTANMRRIRTAWDATMHAFGNVEHFVGNVVHAFGNLVHAGGNVVHAGGNVGHAMGNVAHAIGNVAHAVANVIGWIENAVGAFGRLASAANDALGGIPGKIMGFLGLASGGIAGAAAGRISSGLTLVGEHGPELLALPPSTRVHSAPDTQRMLQAGGRQPIVIRFEFGRSGGLKVEEALLSWIRKTVHDEGGGDVQVAFGWSQ